MNRFRKRETEREEKEEGVGGKKLSKNGKVEFFFLPPLWEIHIGSEE